MAKSLGYKNITLSTIQSPYIPKGMTDQMAQQQKYQTDQTLIMEQMKNMMKTNGKDEKMDKLKMQTANKADENFKKLAEMFPNAVTETIDENGEVVRAIDKDVLMQEINTKVVDGNEERYQFTWPDKKKSVLLANAPINKTLRPVRDDETTPTGADSEENHIAVVAVSILIIQKIFILRATTLRY